MAMHKFKYPRRSWEEPRAAISTPIVPASRRSRLLQPGCWGRYGNRWRRCWRACRSQRASETYPSKATLTLDAPLGPALTTLAGRLPDR
jgi:hypothetical protein